MIFLKSLNVSLMSVSIKLLYFHLIFQKPESESGSSIEVLDQNDIRDRPLGKAKLNPLC